MEILIELLLEFALYFGAELLAEFGFSRGPDRREPAGPLERALTLLLIAGLGAFFAFLFSWLLPERMLPATAWPGVSLVVAPLLGGGAMHLMGRWRRSRGDEPSPMATFWGGAIFALGMAATRFWMVG